MRSDLDTLATVNLEAPGKRLNENGTFLAASWYAITDALRAQGIIHKNEKVVGVRITKYGVSFKLEPDG